MKLAWRIQSIDLVSSSVDVPSLSWRDYTGDGAVMTFLSIVIGIPAAIGYLIAWLIVVTLCLAVELPLLLIATLLLPVIRLIRRDRSRV